MNRIYRSIWNTTLGAWVAAPETARLGGRAIASSEQGKGKLPAGRSVLLRWNGIAGAIAVAWGLLAATPAHALCTTIGSTVSCTGVTIGLVSSTSNLTVNVQNGAQIYPGVVDAVNSVSLTGTGVTVNNGGRIDPSLLPGLVSLASGLNISNNAGSTVTVNNLASGQIMGTSTLLGANLLNLGGVGLVVQNGAGGTTTVNNTGLISGTPLLSAAILAEDIPVIALRGGARNVLTNNLGANITGRVAMQASTLGNVFTNVGTVTGSINLGAGSGANTFNAVTGSVVSGGAGVGVDLGVLGGLGIAYVPAGIVNGGTLNNGNTLNLMNAIGGGSGVTGSGALNGTQYVNFNNLVVSSGTWTLTNQLFKTGTTSPSVNLNGGLLRVDSNGLLGASTLTSNGGSLGNASGTNSTVNSDINLAGNLTATSDLGLTLNGVLSGGGTLIKTGTGTLTLNGVNTLTSGTTLSAGTLALGNASALGASTNLLSVTGASTLTTTSAMTLANAIDVNGANLTVNSASALNLSGAINGTGSLTKIGSADLTLSGANSFGGGLNLNAGRVILSSADAAGSGTITAGVSGTAALDTASAQSLNNLVQLNGNLTLSGSSNLTLAGKISGTGGLNKLGSNTLTLGGANDFTGNSTLGGGALVLQNNTALGTGQLTLTSNSSLLADGLTVGNAINVGTRTLTLTNTAASALSGVLSGTGAIIKNGAGDLTLSGANTFAGVLSLATGKLIVGNNGALGSGSLQAGANTTLDADAAHTVSTNVVLLGNLNIAGSNDLALNGQITGISGSLTKNGSATLTLGGDNLFQNGVLLNAGTLVLGSDRAMGNGTLATAANTTLDANTAVSVNNAVNLVGNMAVGGTSNLSLSGAVNGTGVLNKNGNADFVLAGSSDIGDINVNAGMLGFTGQSHRVRGDLTVAAGANLEAAANQSVVVDGSVTLGRDSTLTLQSLSASPSLNASQMSIGAGVGLNLSGINSPSQLERVLIQSDNAIEGNFSNVMVGGFAGPVDYMTLTTRKSTDSKQYLASYDLSWTANNNLARGSFTLASANETFDVGVSLGDQAANSGWDGKSLTKNGDGTLILSAANSYTGTTTINGGTLLVGKGATSGNLGSGAVINQGTLAFDRSDTVTVANDISGAGTLRQSGTGKTVLTGNNSYQGATTIAAGTLQVGNGGISGNLGTGAVTNNGSLVFNRSDAVTVSNDISGTGSLTHVGTGITTLTGNNSYTGGTFVQAGTLKIGALSSLVQGTLYQVNTGATLDLNGHALQTGGISGTGNVALGSQGLTVNTAAGSISEFDGKMDGTGSLTKSGDGTLSLNTANSFSGGVSHKGGNINLGNEKGLGSGTLAMDDGTKITLTANGMTIANNLHMTGDNDPIVDTGSNNGTWTGAITGAGFLTKQGTGTLTLTSAGNTYTGATDVAQGTLQAGAANTFSSASAHTVASGAVLDLAGYNQTLASLNNSGTVKLSSNTGATPGTVLKVTGAYVGNNGNLGLSTVLGADGSATDKLLLSGASAVASGSTTVHITNAGGLGAQTTGNGIGIIGTENGASLQPGSFTLAGGHVDAGAYEYRLTQTAQGAALHSTTTAPTTPTTPTTAYRAEVPLLSALPAQLRQADMAMLGDLRKRMGDEGTQATTSSDTGASRRVWGRILRTDPKISQQGTVSPESSGHLTGFQAGLDLYADQSIKAGIYVGQLEGDMSVKGFASGVDRKYVGFNNLRTRYLGVYGTWQDQSGLYADAVLQGADYRSDLRTAGDTAQARTKGSGWLASLEMGKAFAVTSNWQIEPQAQIIYRKLSIDDTALSLATVKNKADDDWTVRLGARIKGNFATGAGVLQPYGRINVYKASNTTDIASFAAPGGTTDIKAKGGYTATEMAAGASLQINPRTSVYGELGKLWANGGDSRVKSGVQASIGVKVQW